MKRILFDDKPTNKILFGVFGDLGGNKNKNINKNKIIDFLKIYNLLINFKKSIIISHTLPNRSSSNTIL